MKDATKDREWNLRRASLQSDFIRHTFNVSSACLQTAHDYLSLLTLKLFILVNFRLSLPCSKHLDWSTSLVNISRRLNPPMSPNPYSFFGPLKPESPPPNLPQTHGEESVKTDDSKSWNRDSNPCFPATLILRRTSGKPGVFERFPKYATIRRSGQK